VTATQGVETKERSLLKFPEVPSTRLDEILPNPVERHDLLTIVLPSQAKLT